MLGKVNRLLFGGLLGLLAGFSFNLAILPFLADTLLPPAAGEIYLAVGRWALWCTLLWIPAGALAAWRGGMRRGGEIFGAGGLLGGALIGLLALLAGGAPALLLLSSGAGALYGWGAGLLVGGGFGPATQS
ncbi:MAG: hypothetical protein H3C34_02865 [Caldilineaceae bacterium]|nr:hypothetical protein [Caldilineaceae bacterium]